MPYRAGATWLCRRWPRISRRSRWLRRPSGTTGSRGKPSATATGPRSRVSSTAWTWSNRAWCRSSSGDPRPTSRPGPGPPCGAAWPGNDRIGRIARGRATAKGASVIDDGDWRTTFRPDIPSAARIYDYLLGGKDNYPADRAVAESMIAQLPNVRLAVRWNRAFLRRVVRYLILEAGVRQIIDIGAGLPTAGNTHEVALEACPQARVVYVDHDPIVLAHARSMLHGVPGTAVIGRDLLEPDSILADRSLRELIDFNEPVALLFLSILHFVADEADPAGIISRLLAPFPAGSHVAISHATP